MVYESNKKSSNYDQNSKNNNQIKSSAKIISRKSSITEEQDRKLIYTNINNMSIRDSNSIEIVKRFDFESSLARMSVIVSDKLSVSGWRVYAKGSPEKMHDICIRDSIPS